MRAYSKKQIIILMGAVIIYGPIILLIAQLINSERSSKDFISEQALPFWIVAAIILSLDGLISAWRIPHRILKRSYARLPQENPPQGKTSPETATLYISFGLLVSPSIFGLVLFFKGLPITELYFFVGASVIAGLMWGLYHLRNPSIIPPVDDSSS